MDQKHVKEKHSLAIQIFFGPCSDFVADIVSTKLNLITNFSSEENGNPYQTDKPLFHKCQA